MDTAFLEWVGKTYGTWAPLVLLLIYYAHKNRETKPDVAGDLIAKIDGIGSTVGMMHDDITSFRKDITGLRERVAHMEGKMSND